MLSEKEIAHRRLFRELLQYDYDFNFDSNPIYFLSDPNRRDNTSHLIKQGCNCSHCSDIRDKLAHNFNRRLDLIRNQSNIITSHDKPYLKEMEALIANFTPDQLLNITNNYLFLLGSSWLRFLKAMPEQTLNDLLLSDYLTQLECALTSYKLKNPNISSNTSIFLKDNVTPEEVRDDVEKTFKERYEKRVNDYYEQRRYAQIGMIISTASLIISIASMIILATYCPAALAPPSIASMFLVMGLCCLFDLGVVGCSVLVFPLMTRSVDFFTSRLKENHDTLVRALEKEFPTKSPSFFKPASELASQVHCSMTAGLTPVELEMVPVTNLYR